ncbi:unannotated protein [freshwater metagenome]|uniref:Unannotated protein n=1 Tax=freshwater metagenome TaxID=449393 RepID=A0A6J6FRK6_9ZZZZ|nr:hypothetical protein [Actinomycetota bacterium]
MSDEFEAPKWVQDESNPDIAAPSNDVSRKQKIWLTVTLVFALPFCLWAGWFEFGRAQSGNWRAWVYTFEWPFFGAVALYLWRRIMRGDLPKIPRPDLSALAKEAEEREKGAGNSGQ